MPGNVFKLLPTEPEALQSCATVKLTPMWTGMWKMKKLLPKQVSLVRLYTGYNYIWWKSVITSTSALVFPEQCTLYFSLEKEWWGRKLGFLCVFRWKSSLSVNFML